MSDAWDGKPQAPERERTWHWLRGRTGTVFACFWHDQHWTTPIGDSALTPEMVSDWTYLGPALLPAKVAAAVAEARREGFDAGFAYSGEGWNGEHPGDAQMSESYRERREAFIRAAREVGE